MALTQHWTPQPGGQWAAAWKLDWPLVMELVRLYPIAPPRKMLEQIQTLFRTLRQAQ